jgi:uncharacterized membrane protein
MSSFDEWSDPQDAAGNKVMGILAYLGCLVIIPALAARDSAFARYHVNQGILLILVFMASQFISWIPFLPFKGIFSFVLSAYGLVGIVLGIMNVLNGRMKPIPLLGSIRVYN